jgi:hypothetical protein
MISARSTGDACAGAAGEGHQIVDDRVREARVPLDLRHVRRRPRRVDAREIGARGDDLQHVPQLVRDLGRDFAYHRQRRDALLL